MSKQAYHGGAFFDAIGKDFSTLENSKKIVSADVLDAWFEPSPKVIDKIKEYLPFALKTSPPTHAEGLIQVIAKQRDVPEANIMVGGGSSDLMFSFFPNVLTRGDKVLILDPMYGEYSHIFENVVEVELHRHLLNKTEDFIINYDRLVKDIVQSAPTMVVLVNPNSPTGQYWEKGNITSLTEEFPNITFVVDEAYIDYVGSDKSLEKEAATLSNLVVIKSMSKAYALSGARIAYLVAHTSIIDKVSRFVPPWSVSLVAQIAGVEALKDSEYYAQKYTETNQFREEFMQNLQMPSVRIFGSVANFFLINLIGDGLSAKNIVSELRKEGIYIRNCDSMSKQFNDDFIRIAVKDRETNSKILDALKPFLLMK
ncbi:MAG TPA: histidinol-phosphate transaminase [Candidatus Paceibacterota bacterium]